MIDQAMYDADLGVQLPVAGPDGEGHTIHSIENPGIMHDHSAIGHGAIGSGAPHALYSLIEGSYADSLGKDEVVRLVKKAKKRSEVAPGVGKETTIVAIPGENA